MRERLATRHRLALIGAVGVIVAMVAALVAFNVFERWQIEGEAVASVDDALGWDAGGTAAVTRAAYYLYLDEDFQLVNDDGMWYAELDEELAAWCASHPELDVVRRVEVAGSTCYVELAEAYSTPAAWALNRRGASCSYLAAYVDVSSQIELVDSVNVVFALIALAGAGAAGWAGWRMGRRIEAADEAQRRFYENVSHELKTPLASIRGYAEGMQAGVVEPERACGAIVRESERMSRLVEEILSLSRLEAGAVVAHPEPVEVADLVQDCLMPFEGVARMKGLDVRLDLAPGTVNADPELVGHALENVLSNAMRHAATMVRVAYDGRELSVANDGTLPPAEDVAHLFERFRTSEGGSTGIGLALAKEVAEMHGWQVGATLEGELLRIFFLMG